MSHSTPNLPSPAELREAALAAVRIYLPQRNRNDSRSREAYARAWGAMKSYAVAAGVPFAQVLGELTEAAKKS